MSAPVAAPAAGGDGDGSGSVAGGFLNAIGCDNCMARTGLMTRVLMAIGVCGTVLSLTPAPAYFACSPDLIFSSGVVGIYRLFVSPFCAMGLLSGLFALLTVWPLAVKAEEQRGSVWLAWTTLVLTFATNGVIIVLGLLFGLLAQLDISWMFTIGLWPVVFGLMALDCMQDPDAPRPFCCFPGGGFAAKYHPPVMLLLFTLLAGLDAGMIVGMAMGYAMSLRPRLQLSLSASERYESSTYLARVRAAPGFVPAAAGGVSASGAGQWAGGERTGAMAGVQQVPPSRFGTIHGPSSSSSSAAGSAAPASQPQASHVFAGQGHRLGDGTPSQIVMGGPSSSGSSVGASSETSAAQAEERRKRAAAIDARLGKSATGGPRSPSNSSSGAAASASSRLSTLVGPPSPSGHRSSGGSGGGSQSFSAAAPGGPSHQPAQFSLGLEDSTVDSDDDIYAVDGDDLEQQRGQERQQAPSASPHGGASSSRLDLSEQGYSQSRGKGKSGYAQVAAPSTVEDDEDDIELGAGSARTHDDELELEEVDHSTERTTLQTHR